MNDNLENIIDRRLYFFNIWGVLYSALYEGALDDILFEEELDFVHQNLLSCEAEIVAIYGYVHNKIESTEKFKENGEKSDEEIDI